MRVLQIHKTFRLTGGADTFFFKTCDLLAEHGHEVAHFSTKHPQNRPSPFANYFVDGFTEGGVNHLSMAQKAKGFFNGIYSFDAKESLSRLVQDFKPDLAHAHSFNYQLSPSIFDVFRKSGIPLVVTLHDYHFICGAATLYVDGALCERCRGGRHYNLLRHSCYWNLPASLMATVSHYVHDARRTWSVPSKLLSPSRFLQGKLIEFGIPASSIAPTVGTRALVFHQTCPMNSTAATTRPPWMSWRISASLAVIHGITASPAEGCGRKQGGHDPATGALGHL